MGDPARQEEQSVGLCGIGRVEAQGITMKEIAGMIEHHDDHDNAAQQINAVEAMRA